MPCVFDADGYEICVKALLMLEKHVDIKLLTKVLVCIIIIV